MAPRGEFAFDTDARGRLADTPENLERTRKMFRDWGLILYHGGPGTKEGDNGSWHVLCHLAGAAALFADGQGRPGWAGITYDDAEGAYRATFSFEDGKGVRTLPLSSSDARATLGRFAPRGYVEGASRGHILDRKAKDPGDSRLVDRRQDYDRSVNSDQDGGPVWEHWCTSRDIVKPKSLGSGLLAAYHTLVSSVGGRLAATVARGRFEPEYSHLLQLRGMVRAGFVSAEDVSWDVTPVKIPSAAEKLLYEARPAEFLKAVKLLLKSSGKDDTYHMYSRKIASFVPSALAMKVVTAS
jgi:hypothetical protein